MQHYLNAVPMYVPYSPCPLILLPERYMALGSVATPYAPAFFYPKSTTL
jgi:hypothetical protein